MSILKDYKREELQQDALEVISEIELAFGMVPNLFKAYSFHPLLLKANWEKVKAIMMQGSLSRKTKEAIAVLVSKDNSCKYCVAAHKMSLKSIGVDDAEIQLIENDIENANFSDAELAVIAFARKANSSPLKIGEAEMDKVLNTGVSKQELVEALGVMELFTAFNKFLDSLNIEIDF